LLNQHEIQKPGCTRQVADIYRERFKDCHNRKYGEDIGMINQLAAYFGAI
jgi:hypothetical protein